MKRMKTSYIETDIDRLFHWVKERGRVKFSEAAKKFNVSEEQIEEWAEILEDHNLVKLHYPIGKNPEIIYIDIKIKTRSKSKKPSKFLPLGISMLSVSFLCIYLIYVYTVDTLRNYNIRAVINEKINFIFAFLSVLPYPLNNPVVFILIILILIMMSVLIKKNLKQRKQKTKKG